MISGGIIFIASILEFGATLVNQATPTWFMCRSQTDYACQSDLRFAPLRAQPLTQDFVSAAPKDLFLERIRPSIPSRDANATLWQVWEYGVVPWFSPMGEAEIIWKTPLFRWSWLKLHLGEIVTFQPHRNALAPRIVVEGVGETGR
jgi:hypothetical protein